VQAGVTAPVAAKSGPPTTLAEGFQKVKKIKDALTINQKFMFTKILFNGDFELFSNAIDRLDDLDNLNQANSYLSNNFGEWNKDSEEYQEFMDMVQKRFG
jgi:predicted nucleotidyltransferase